MITLLGRLRTHAHVHYRDWAVLAAFTAVAFLNSGTPARANLVITPTFDSSITSDPNAASIEGVINQAISIYESKLTNPITVNIEFASMNSGLGQSSTAFATLRYQSFINALTANATSADDATALAHLPNGPNNPVTGSTLINVKTANLKALGIAFSPPQFDGTVSLNTHITDIGTPGGGPYSLLATTEHEIDEVLGLGSALPTLTNPFPEDLFRYNGSGGRSFTTSSTALAFFSIDGTTKLAQFDNQNDGGDFGDWQSNPLPNGVSPQVQDAFATPGANPALGVELRALDVIGYNLSVVPEPSTLAVAGLSGILCLAYGCVRCRQRKP
jgi:hypothetical protein